MWVFMFQFFPLNIYSLKEVKEEKLLKANIFQIWTGRNYSLCNSSKVGPSSNHWELSLISKSKWKGDNLACSFPCGLWRTLCSKKVFQGPEGGKIKTVIKYFGASFVCNLSKLFELCDINQQPFCFGAALWFEENK